MGFMDDLSGFGRNISQKTKDMVDITANNSQISKLEEKIREVYLALGQKYFSDKITDTECEYQEYLVQIRQLMSEIKNIQDKNKAIEDAQAQVAQAAADAKAFKQSQIDSAAQSVEEAKVKEAMANGGKVCPNCGEIVPAGNAFCMKCGTKAE